VSLIRRKVMDMQHKTFAAKRSLIIDSELKLVSSQVQFEGL